MGRQSFKAEPPKKSPWLNARGKKPEKPRKPEFPPTTGTFKCPECGSLNEITTYTERIVEWPYPKAYFSGEYCKGKVPTSPGAKEMKQCGALLTGWLIIED